MDKNILFENLDKEFGVKDHHFEYDGVLLKDSYLVALAIALDIKNGMSYNATSKKYNRTVYSIKRDLETYDIFGYIERKRKSPWNLSRINWFRLYSDLIDWRTYTEIEKLIIKSRCKIQSPNFKLYPYEEDLQDHDYSEKFACYINDVGFKAVVNIATLGLGTYLGFKLKEHADIDHEMLEIDNPWDRDQLRVDRFIDEVETCPKGSAIVIRNHGEAEKGLDRFTTDWYRNAEWTEDPEYGAEKSLLIENKSFKPKSE